MITAGVGELLRRRRGAGPVAGRRSPVAGPANRYIAPVTAEDHWIGDLGHLALADATVGELLIDILTLLEHAAYPDAPRDVDLGLTTKQAAIKVRAALQREPALFGDDAGSWLSDVIEVTDVRNALLHAVALNRCGTCGLATRFVHPRSGSDVDRSVQAVRDLTARVLALYRDGLLFADEVAERVNARIVEGARRMADQTGEVQNPPQVRPHHASHQCAGCAANGRGATSISLGTAVLVYPRALREALFEPPTRLPQPDVDPAS